MKLTHTFKLDGEEVTGRCTFKAINEFEETSGLSIAEAWGKLSENKLRFSTIAIAVWAFINGERSHSGQREISKDVVGAKVHQDGFMEFVSVAGQFFLMTLPEQKATDKASSADEKKSQN